MSLSSLTKAPMTLECTDLGIEVQVSTSKHKLDKFFIVKINSVNYFKLKYQAPTFIPGEGALNESLRAKICINGKTVLDGSMPWSVNIMQEMIELRLEGKPMRSLAVERI